MIRKNIQPQGLGSPPKTQTLNGQTFHLTWQSYFQEIFGRELNTKELYSACLGYEQGYYNKKLNYWSIRTRNPFVEDSHLEYEVRIDNLIQIAKIARSLGKKHFQKEMKDPEFRAMAELAKIVRDVLVA